MRALLALLLVAACSHPERVATPAPATRPTLVVLIVVDQLPTWAFDRDRPVFHGGLARLLRDGAFVRAGELPYANPFTAPGHATIATGAPPSVHGVIGNSWYRRSDARERSAEYDRDAPVLPVGPSQGGELTPEDGASSRELQVDGIADVLRAASPRAKSIAIGLKPRAAAFVAGKRPDLAVWYEASAGGMTTSRAYASATPAWLVQLAKDKPASRFFDAVWEARDAALLARVTGIPDDAPGEGDLDGFATKFPHALANVKSPAKVFLHTPFADEVVFDAAIAALDAMQLGADEVPDLLALSFNAHDYAGHLWGPDSWEALDLTLRFDERLGSFLDLLDRKIGKGRWAAVLTSDHGATPIVERSPTKGARRIRSAEITDAVEAAVAGKLGKGPWVAAVLSSNVYLVPAFADRATDERSAALDAAASAIAKLANVAAAGRVDQLGGDCTKRDALLRALCWMLYPAESGELYVVPTAGSLITDYTSGTHHDAPFDDNRRVPIIVMAPGLAPQQGDGSLLQVAPTLAALLGVPPPPAATARPLFGIH